MKSKKNYWEDSEQKMDHFSALGGVSTLKESAGKLEIEKSNQIAAIGDVK